MRDSPSLVSRFQNYLAASTEALRKSFISFMISSAALRARVPGGFVVFGYLSLGVLSEKNVLGLDLLN